MTATKPEGMYPFSVSLRSGSSGNSTFIRTESAGIAIDCGLNGRQFALALQSIGQSPRAVDALLLTHEHTDHCSGLGVVMRRHHIPLYLTEKTYQAVKDDLGKVKESLIHLIEPGHAFMVRDVRVLPFSTPHDAVDSVGFRLETADGDIGVATDLGHFSETVRQGLAGCKIVHLESNYEPDMLETGPYPAFLKRRIAGSRGHLSNQEAGLAASWLVRHGTRLVVLSHLSEENNHPRRALEVVRSYLPEAGAGTEDDFQIHVSPRHVCSGLFSCKDHLVGQIAPNGTSRPGDQLSWLEPDQDEDRRETV